MFDNYVVETVTDEQIQSILAPVISMIIEGRINDDNVPVENYLQSLSCDTAGSGKNSHEKRNGIQQQ